MVFLLLLFFAAFSGSSWAETTSEPLQILQNKYQNLTNSLNRLVILSEQDMIKLQAQLPALILEAQELKQSVSALQTEAKSLQIQADGLSLELQTLKTQLTALKTEIEKLSASLANSERLMKLFTSELKRMKARNNTGLIISAAALLISIGFVGYNLYEKGMEGK